MLFIVAASNFLVALFFICIEQRFPARLQPSLKTVGFDLFAYLCTVPLAIFYLAMNLKVELPAPLLNLSLPIRILLFYISNDLLYYFLHRLAHTRFLWPLHSLHHSSPNVYWLAGFRASFLQQVFFTLPAIPALAFLHQVPTALLGLITVEMFFRNSWIHSNIRWNSEWLDAILVTPKNHLIHHSRLAQHHHKNFGGITMIWDRLFGTYAAPESARDFPLGSQSSKSLLRQVLGI